MVLTRVLPFALLTAVVACGGGSAAPQPDGPLALGIIAGQNQLTTAGSDKLSSPVVGRLVRQSNGRVGFQWIERAVDPLLPPKAYAQTGTVVTGSPVPGAVVCAVSAPNGRGLVPFTPCTNTDVNGEATFFFTPGTVAGEATAEIRGTVDNQPAVFDTAKATVLPGPAADIIVASVPSPPRQPGETVWNPWTTTRIVAPGSTLDLHTVIGLVRDAYNNTIAGGSVAADGYTFQPIPDSTSWTPTYAVCAPNCTGTPTPQATSWTITPPSGATSLVVYLFGTPTSSVHATYFEVSVR